MKPICLALAICLYLSTSAMAQVWAPEHQHTADVLGTVGVYSQIGMATFTAFKEPDRKQALLREGCALGVAVGVSQLLKMTIHEERPNGVDNKSFPSMHSAAAMAASGWRYEIGLPLAAFVGVSRVNANWHHPRDVLAGWGIGAAAQALCHAGLR